MESIARVQVRGRGLLVTEATTGAIAVTQRPLLGMPLSETVPEYDEALRVIRRAVMDGEAGTKLVLAPNGAIGRVTADPTPNGAYVTFVPAFIATQELHGRDLVMGWANDVFHSLVDRPIDGIAAREAFPEDHWAEAQDALAWVMRSGERVTVPLLTGEMRIVRTGPRKVTTAWQPCPPPR